MAFLKHAKHLAGAGFFSLLLSPAAIAAELPRGTTFFDGFDTLNHGIWGVSDGWVNGDWQNCEWAREAVAVENGRLSLTFAAGEATAREHTCGEIQTRHTYGYGAYEARARTPEGSGLNAAFFTYIGPHHGQPHDEIDFEVLTRDTARVSLNTYVDGQPANGASVPLPAPADDGFQTYSFIWAEDGIRWYVDGALVHETAPGTPLPSTPQKIYASFWGSDTYVDWMGPFVDPGTPIAMEIDWIAFTAEGEGCQFAGSVLCALE